MTKLPPRHVITQRWLRNLRSGGFKQGILFLRDTSNRYCCLGVLCETINELVPGYITSRPGSQHYIFYINDEDSEVATKPSASFPPLVICKHMGLSSEDLDTISAWNDIKHCSFKWIAESLPKAFPQLLKEPKNDEPETTG